MQGITPAGGAMGDLVAASRDGGRTWRRSVPPGINNCTGNPDYDRNGDPWVGFDSAGTPYLVSHAGSSARDVDSAIPFSGRRAEFVSTSGDGGFSWSPPTLVLAALTGTGAIDRNDKPAIAADPVRPGRAVLLFNKLPGGVSGSSIWTSRTTDGNKTWAQQSPVYLPPPGIFAASPVPIILPSGTVLNAFSEFDGSLLLTAPDPEATPPETLFRVSRSTDGGATWSSPITIGRAAAAGLRDREQQHTIFPFYSVVHAAADPDGRAYIVWAENDKSLQSGRVMISHSEDDGRTWSPARAAARSDAQMISPAVATMPDGTVGVSWLDLRHERPGDKELTTVVRFAHSHDRGGSWSEVEVSSRFDFRNAIERTQYVIPGWFLGDYYGLAGTSDGFIPVWIQTKTGSGDDTSDMMAARLVEKSGSRCLARRAPIGLRNIGRVRLGYSRPRLLRLPVKPIRRMRRSFRYCVKRSAGQLSAVLSRRGRVVLVATTARTHGTRGVRPGSRAEALRAAYPGRRALVRGLYQVGRRSPRLIGVRHGRVRFVAVADRRLLRKPRALRRYLRFAGL